MDVSAETEGNIENLFTSIFKLAWEYRFLDKPRDATPSFHLKVSPYSAKDKKKACGC